MPRVGERRKMLIASMAKKTRSTIIRVQIIPTTTFAKESFAARTHSKTTAPQAKTIREEAEVERKKRKYSGLRPYRENKIFLLSIVV